MDEAGSLARHQLLFEPVQASADRTVVDSTADRYDRAAQQALVFPIIRLHPPSGDLANLGFQLPSLLVVQAGRAETMFTSNIPWRSSISRRYSSITSPTAADPVVVDEHGDEIPHQRRQPDPLIQLVEESHLLRGRKDRTLEKLAQLPALIPGRSEVVQLPV